MSDVKPNYVRAKDMHSHTDGCDDKLLDGSSYCIPVYAAADYKAAEEALHFNGQMYRDESKKRAKLEVERDSLLAQIASLREALEGVIDMAEAYVMQIGYRDGSNNKCLDAARAALKEPK